MKKQCIVLFCLVAILSILSIPSYAIVGTQLLHNTGFEDPITWEVVTSRSLQMNRWGLHPWSATDIQQLFAVDTAHQGTGYIRTTGDGVLDRTAIQWVDVSQYAGKGYRVFGGGWAMRGPNCVATPAAGNFWPTWSNISTSDYLNPSQSPFIVGVSSNVVALNYWQPIISIDFELPAEDINLGPTVYLSHYAGAGPFEHYWDDVRFWLNDQVTEYKAINFDTVTTTVVIDTTLGGPDEQSCYYPIVIEDEGVYKMWYAASRNNIVGITTTTINTICYATSSNGINWTKLGAVLTQDTTIPYESYRFYPGPVIKEVVDSTTTYKMFYSPVGTGPDQTSNRYRLALATSPDGINWTRYPGNPLLGCNTTVNTGYMNYFGIEFPSITKMDGKYRMWCSGYGLQRMGYSESTDGITWSQPIFNMFTGWTTQNPIDKTYLNMPSVVYDAESGIYHVWYSAYPSIGISGNTTVGYTIGHAVSDDGIFWTKDPRNPVISRGLLGSVNNMTYHPTVLREGNRYKMWYTVNGTIDNFTTARIAYTEGTVESSATQIIPDNIVKTQGNTVMFTQSGGVAPVSWLSSDSTIASIESTTNNGRTAYVKSNAIGSTTITATDFYGNVAIASMQVVSTGVPIYPEQISVLNLHRKIMSELFE